MLRNRHIGSVSLALMLASSVAADPSYAQSSNDVVLPASPTYEANGVTVDEKTGSVLPPDAQFRTSDGALITLREALAGELPTILTFNYNDCPMLCSLQLNGLSAVLPALATKVDWQGKQVGFAIGQQFRILSIDLEPNESLEKLAKMKERYIARLPEAQRADAQKGWTFLAAATPGDDTQIRRVADTVGFKYVYIPSRAEWAHPAALIFLSTRGVVTRYVYGIEFDAGIMRESIVKAGLAEMSTAIGFMNRCYHFDPDAKSHSRAGVFALRLGAAGFVALLVIGFGAHFLRRRREPGES
ncbi:MAG: SCO family protein [Kofleriaceae bacterium]